jgi:hypothetical protein
MKALKEQFEEKDANGNGLNAAEFTYVMVKCLGAFVFNRVDFVVQCMEFFRQVDVNDDKSMEWEELTSYIVEAGMAKAGGLLLISCSVAVAVTEPRRLCPCFPTQ